MSSTSSFGSAPNREPGGAEWVLDAVNECIRHGQREVPLTPRAFALLSHLVDRRPQLATTEDILKAVWPNVVVEEGQVRQFIADLRRALGDDPKAPRLIETVRGRGYRFIGDIRVDGPLQNPGRVLPLHTDAASRRMAALYGREDDLAALREQVATHRLVTIVGPGGIGKTLLVRHLALQLRAQHPDGVIPVELAPLGDPSRVAEAIAEAAGVPAHGPGALGALAVGLAERRALLVLDNAEHLLDEAARVVQDLLDRAPRLRLVVTSQIPLHVAGEQVYRLGPLPVPPATADPQDAESHGAVALFAARARAVSAGFALDAATTGPVIDICRRLDGVPLALELAAARVGSLGLVGLAEAIEAGLHDAPAPRGVPLRQRTLAAALDWTHGLLSPVQQVVLRRLGVFAGPFDRAMAQAVAADADAGGRIDAAAAAGALEALVDGSLVTPVDTGAVAAVEPRWRLLQATRAYALDRLADAGEVPAVRRRQIACHLAAVTAASERLTGDAGAFGTEVEGGDATGGEADATGAEGADAGAEAGADTAGGGAAGAAGLTRPAAARRGPGDDAAHQAIAERYADIRGALEWAFADGGTGAGSGARAGATTGDPAAGAMLAVALLPYWRSRPHRDEGERWLQRPAREGLDRDADGRLELLVRRLRAEGIVGPAGSSERGGIGQATLMALARRLDDRELRDVDSALRQLQGAVGLVRAAVATPAAHAGAAAGDPRLDGLVTGALTDVAACTGIGDFDRGVDVIDTALATLDRQEAERAAAVAASRRALLEAGLRQDLLRRDAFAAADRVLAIAAVGHGPGHPAWAEEARQRGEAFRDEGERQGINLSLQVATELARRRIDGAAEAREQRDALRDLGALLVIEGERQSGAEALEEAAAVLRQALAATPCADEPAVWVVLQGELGRVLGLVGLRLGRLDLLQAATEACRSGLAARRRADAPQEWADAQHRLATALRHFGALGTGTATLEEALQAYGEALKVHTPARDPLRLARSKLGLGVTHSLIARREGGVLHMHRAIQAYRDGLREIRREVSPIDWGNLQNNLAIELAALGQKTGDAAILRDAVATYRQAAQEVTREKAPGQWAATQHNLGGALRWLGELEPGTECLTEAVVAFQEALREHRRERLPAHWAASKNDLGLALLRLGERQVGGAGGRGGAGGAGRSSRDGAGGGTATLEEAVRVLRQALEVRTRDRGEMPWASTLVDLAEALLAFGDAGGGAAAFGDAAAACRQALEVLSPDAMPEEHLRARRHLEQALGRQLHAAAP